MQKRFVTVALVCLFAIAATSCAQNPKNPQTVPPAQPVQARMSCPPLLQMANVQTLGCFVDQNHRLWVGNASASPIPQGTKISLSAKRLETSGNCTNPVVYCATVPAPEPIPPHLFILVLGYQPIFDDQAPCQAWREVPPVLTQ